MFVQTSPPKISYLGVPTEFKEERKILNSPLDLFSIILDLCSYNLSLDIKTTSLDLSEFQITEEFFKDPIEEESPQMSKIIDKINHTISKNGVKIYCFILKDYFLASQIPDVKKSTVRLLNRISEIFDAIGISYPCIVTRIGSAYGNRKKTMTEFCEVLEGLEDSVKSKISVTNDDKPSLFSVTDLLSGVYYKTSTPIFFRMLSHQFNDGGLTAREALFLSGSTWKQNEKPSFLYSESSEYDENGIPLTPASSKYLTRKIPTLGLDMDVIIESQEKEDCCLKYRMEHKSLPPVVINKVEKNNKS